MNGSPDDRSKLLKVLLIVGLVLCTGPLIGLLGTVVGMVMSFNKIEEMRSPTPDDLAAGVHLSLGAATAGLVAGMLGALLVVCTLVALNRLKKRELTTT